jgi:hypothetical protein
VDIFSLQAVSRSHGQFEIIDRLEQNRVERRCRAFESRHIGALEISKGGQLIDQNAGGIAHGTFGFDRAVGLDFEHELVKIGTLLDASRFDRVTHALDRAEGCIQQNRADLAIGSMTARHAHRRRDITATALDFNFEIDLASGGEIGNHVLGIDDFDLMRSFDITCCHRARARFAQNEDGMIAIVELDD